MNQQTFAKVGAMALLSSWANAAIAENGLWTGNDWYDSALEIGVINGIPYSNDPDVSRRITSPLTVDGFVADDYLGRDNVQRVMSIFTQQQWDDGFPLADPVYTYENFLKAVAKFPAFCNETGVAGRSLEDSCRRELAGIFAHWGQETGKRDPADGEFWTQALYWVQEIRCNGTNDPSCDYYQSGWTGTAYPKTEGKQYYGRGPFQLSWNYNYGMFSNVFAPSSYNSKLYLLQQPEIVHENGDLAMTAGIWFYMTPQDPKPSMHDVMAGFFEPTSADIQANIGANFGTTTNIINGGLECGMASTKADSRGIYFNKWLEFFGLPTESNVGCADQGSFPTGGAGDVPGYWEQSWQGATECRPVGYQTQYSMSARDDYKRCVCDKFGQGEASCPQADGSVPDPTPTPDPTPDPTPNPDPTPDPTPNPDPSPTPTPDPYTTWQTLEQIRANPHYDAQNNHSRTMYQVDRELAFLEDKFVELFQAAVDNGVFTV